MCATQVKMQPTFSCPDEIKRNPYPNLSKMPKYSDENEPNCPPLPSKTLPEKNDSKHGMTLRRSPKQSIRQRYMQSTATVTGLELPISPTSLPIKSRLRSGSKNHGHPSPTTLEEAVNSHCGDPLPGACRKDRKQKTANSVFSSLTVPEQGIDYSSISTPFTEHLLDCIPKTRITRGQKRVYTPDSSDRDPLVFSVSPLRVKPEDPDSSTPFNTPAKGVSKRRIESQTTSEPRKGTKHESSPTSRTANAPPDQQSQLQSQLSSDLSIEFCFPEEELIHLPLEEEDVEEDEVDEELPRFLMQIPKKPTCIKDGDFVWSKYRSFPFWPAVVKHVNPKMRKASIIWIDMPTIDKKRKGWYVPLKSLKQFDCEEAKQLECAAKTNYAAVIDWSLELINDYIFRIACASFTGSFIEYWTHIMSSPVRSKYPQEVLEGLALPSRVEFDERSQSGAVEDGATETPKGGRQAFKRLLPDRTMAAHNRANEKLVHFIVSQHMVDQHLLAVIRGQQPSKWLRSFLKATRRLQVWNYLEDDGQLDQVYTYLKELFDNVTDHAPCLANVKFMDDVRFAMDVLLPEAIISAIAGVDNISLQRAEEKYMNGRCISDREREKFELTIGQQIRKK